MEQTEEIRHTLGIKEKYQERKETIERVFADAKEKHGMRYTQYRGLDKIKMKLNLLFSCMNLKKLAIWKWRKKWGTWDKGLPTFCTQSQIWRITTKWFSGNGQRTILSTVRNEFPTALQPGGTCF